MEKLICEKEAKTETLTNSLNGKTAAVKAVGKGRAKKIFVMKAGEEKAAKAVEPKEKKKAKETSAPKIPHVGVDFIMPSLEQVAKFVKEEAEKGTKALTATELRKHFSVPNKIPMSTRLGQLERAGFGKFERIGKSNTLTLDLEAIEAGKAAIKKKRKAKKKA